MNIAPRLLPARDRGPSPLDKTGIRARNRGMLLRAIWSQPATSRADLARATGMSRSATSALVEELLTSGLVEETGQGVSSGGRRPTMLTFVDDAFHIIGVDMGSTHISLAVTDLRGRVVHWRTTQCETRDNPGVALERIGSMIDSAMVATELSPEALLGIGLSVPSPVDPQDPGQLPPLFLPAWHGVDLMEALDRPAGVRLLIDNDANLGALAESWWGAGQDSSDLAFIKLGTGIGAGFVVEGHIFRGHGGMAGEIGHLVIDPHGPKCVCGLRGCLVTFIGTPALLAAARARRADAPDSMLPADPDLSALIAAVRHGDRLARAIIAEGAERLGMAVSGLLNLMNPATVVLGGELATVGDALLHPLRACVQQRSVWTAVAHSRIVASQLGEQDVALGAATQVLQWALVRPERFPVGWRV